MRARCGASSATTMAAAWREKEEGPAVDPFDVEKMGAQGQHVINWYVGCSGCCSCFTERFHETPETWPRVRCTSIRQGARLRLRAPFLSVRRCARFKVESTHAQRKNACSSHNNVRLLRRGTDMSCHLRSLSREVLLL